MTGRLKDTICAIATPIGEGAISIIRVSGESALQSVSKHFRGKLELASAKSHTVHHGMIIDSMGNAIDDVLCTVFRSPTSYTGEDSVEVSCHGGIHVTRRVLECFIETGIRLAYPGEFTQRAFLNGKLDLAQAEAVAELIQARSDKAYKISLDQLEGSLSKVIHNIRDQLVKSLSYLELELDFIEEDIELIDKKNIEKLLNENIVEIEKLLSTYKYGKIWKDGLRVALIGVPNAGKSSLLNALLNENRAIVTDIPGTTRDFIEEEIVISGVVFRLIDTAGLRKTGDVIEEEGIKRSWKIAQSSDIIILVHDSTAKIAEVEIEFLDSMIKKHHQKRVIIANNKVDLHRSRELTKFREFQISTIETSTVGHGGVQTLVDELTKFVSIKAQKEADESITIIGERHHSALLKAKKALHSSLESLKNKESNEFVAVEIRTAIDWIGEIVGIVTTEDILNKIFSKFCVGK